MHTYSLWTLSIHMTQASIQTWCLRIMLTTYLLFLKLLQNCQIYELSKTISNYRKKEKNNTVRKCHNYAPLPVHRLRNWMQICCQFRLRSQRGLDGEAVLRVGDGCFNNYWRVLGCRVLKWRVSIFDENRWRILGCSIDDEARSHLTANVNVAKNVLGVSKINVHSKILSVLPVFTFISSHRARENAPLTAAIGDRRIT